VVSDLLLVLFVLLFNMGKEIFEEMLVVENQFVNDCFV
jgi:hypothetical protein